MAQFAAYNLRKHCGTESGRISVYTFGCPRIGNHTFALEYEAAVPITLHIVNVLDALAWKATLWFAYKRVGKWVITNLWATRLQMHIS